MSAMCHLWQFFFSDFKWPLISCIPQSRVWRKKEPSQPAWETINPRAAGHMRLWPQAQSSSLLSASLPDNKQSLSCTHNRAWMSVRRTLVNTGRCGSALARLALIEISITPSGKESCCQWSSCGWVKTAAAVVWFWKKKLNLQSG